MTLLEKAKSNEAKITRYLNYTQEHVDLAVAWAKDEVSYGQVANAIGKGKGQISNFLSQCLKIYIKSLNK